MKFKLTGFILFFAITTFARVGIADWKTETPNGNVINNFSDITLYLKNGQELKWVADWYFYNNHIIGRLGNKYRYLDTVGFFVIDESTYKIDTFQNESAWALFIEQNNLKPQLWKRVYRKDWTVINGRLLYAFILGFYIAIPATILFLAILIRAFKRENFNRKKPYTITIVIVLALIFIRWLLDTFPQSW